MHLSFNRFRFVTFDIEFKTIIDFYIGTVLQYFSKFIIIKINVLSNSL